MRVTNNMMADNMLYDLNNNLTKMLKTEQQLSSGVKIQLPSDDPVGTARLLMLKKNSQSNDKYIKNAQDASSWLNYTDSALDNLTQDMARIKELTVDGATGTLAPSDMKSIAEEIGQIRDDIYTLGNSTYTDRYIFGGFDTQTAPLTKITSTDGTGIDDINMQQPDIPSDYVPDEINYEIGDNTKISINTNAYQVFGPVTDADGNAITGDLFSDLKKLENALNTGDQKTVSDMIDTMDKHSDQILAVRADIGAKVNRLDLVTSRLQDNSLNITDLLSKTEDVDMAQAATNLSTQQSVYQASLQIGAKVLLPTLLDFIK